MPAAVEPAYAVELARRGLARRPESVPARQAMGMALYRAGRWDEAIAALTRATEPEDEKVLAFPGFFLAMAHHRKGDRREARSWYDRSLARMAEHNRDDPTASRYRAEAAALLGVGADRREDPVEPDPEKCPTSGCSAKNDRPSV